jgi:hypothetical protein
MRRGILSDPSDTEKLRSNFYCPWAFPCCPTRPRKSIDVRTEIQWHAIETIDHRIQRASLACIMRSPWPVPPPATYEVLVRRFTARRDREARSATWPGEYAVRMMGTRRIAAGERPSGGGLRDRSADFERSRKLILIPALVALGYQLAVGLLLVRLLAEASVPSLCPHHEQDAHGLGLLCR